MLLTTYQAKKLWWEHSMWSCWISSNVSPLCCLKIEKSPLGMILQLCPTHWPCSLRMRALKGPFHWMSFFWAACMFNLLSHKTFRFTKDRSSCVELFCKEEGERTTTFYWGPHSFRPIALEETREWQIGDGTGMKSQVNQMSHPNLGIRFRTSFYR